MRPSSFEKTIWRTDVSPYVRLKGCLDTTGTKTHGHCYTCGRKNIPFAELEAGHCIPKYGNAIIMYEEDNLRIQCNNCNDVRRGNGMRATFEANLRKEIKNARFDRLLVLKKKIKYWTIEELQEIRAKYRKLKEELQGTAK